MQKKVNFARNNSGKSPENICIVQARVNSSRLPGKVLMNLNGKTVLQRVLERISVSRTISEVAVATGMGHENIPIVKLCAEMGIRVFCGSEKDVLDRFYQFAKLICPENIVRVTSDCPLIDPRIIDLVVRAHLTSNADYTSNTIPPTFPEGEDVEVFTFEALKKAWQVAELPSEREHVTPFIWKHGQVFKRHFVANPVNLSKKRWTLDHPADFTFISEIYRAMNNADIFGIDDILNLLKECPELEKINNNIPRSEGYNKSLREDAKSK